MSRSQSRTPHHRAEHGSCVEEWGREVFVLQASPLFHAPINARLEVEMLQEAMTDAGARVQLRVGTATVNSLGKLLTVARRSRGGLVLHLSAHCILGPPPERKIGLCFEDGRGAPHILWKEQLEEILGVREQGLKNVSLVFLSACWSQELAQVFVECGCRHVISLTSQVQDAAARKFAQQFYLGLGASHSLKKAWESARLALQTDDDPGLRAHADHFMLFGHYGADEADLEALFRGSPKTNFSGLCKSLSPSAMRGGGVRELEDASVFLQSSQFLPPRPRPEDFWGREAMILELLHCFKVNERRALLLHGPEGIGKSTLGNEFAHFASAPGRLFSCAALCVRLESAELADIVGALEEALSSIQELLTRPFSPSGNEMRRRFSMDTMRSQHSNGSLISTPSNRDMKQVRQRLRRGFQDLERLRRGQKVLLVVDDEVGAVAASREVQRLLGGLLEYTQALHLMVCSRQPVYEVLGRGVKVVNQQLPSLRGCDAAKLLLRSIHRPLLPADFPPFGRPSGGTVMEEILPYLSNHPLLQRLEGNPGNISEVASLVVPGGPTLMQLADMEASQLLRRRAQFGE